ncbi:acyl-CoA-binding protein homolog [Cimex lectularius]|uniref:ACB domain-containing protein n=1 Tax=Cimex lectularius TaxID=79782 RepID=A0A8I6RCV0_CIMLE|nr:acyl-CoA-binding protein homolog [Cimex lectularius]
MSLEESFNECAERVKTALTKRPTNEELLQLYALYKQAAIGDNNTSKPGMMDVKGKYKWEAWNKKKGTSKEDAMKEYIKFVEYLISCYA